MLDKAERKTKLAGCQSSEQENGKPRKWKVPQEDPNSPAKPSCAKSCSVGNS